METALHCCDLREKIGQGAFGAVFKGYTKNNHTPVAIKRIERDNVTEKALNEYDALLAVCGHENIVKLLELHKDQHFIYIVMEYCSKGDLDSFLSQSLPNYRIKLDIMRQCAAGVSYMHSISPQVVHRDLKPQNILLHQSPSGQLMVKIGDFGLAKVLTDTDGRYMSTSLGTLAFMAPQLLMPESHYTAMVDNYALGLVFAVIGNYSDTDKERLPLTVDFPRHPYFSFGQRQILSRDGNQPPPSLYLCPRFAGNHPRMRSLIVEMTNFDPKDRTKMNHVEAEITQEISDLDNNLAQLLMPRIKHN